MPAARATKAAMERAIDAVVFLTIHDIAGTLAISERTVARLCVKGAIPAYRVGRQWRVAQADFLRWLRESKSGEWRQFINVVASGGSGSNGTGRKSDSPLAQLLKAKPASISNNYKASIAS